MMHPLSRSNHSMCTVCTKEERQPDGRTYYEYKSYIFGGLVKNDQGVKNVSSDLFEVRTKYLTISKGNKSEMASTSNLNASEMTGLRRQREMTDMD